MTMQEDINGVLLKIKELRDSEGHHLQFKEDLDQIVKRHQDKIDQAVDDLELQAQEIINLKRDVKERLSMIEYEIREEAQLQEITSLQEAFTAMMQQSTGGRQLEVPKLTRKAVSQTSQGAASSSVVQKLKELTESLDQLSSRQKKIDQ